MHESLSYCPRLRSDGPWSRLYGPRLRLYGPRLRLYGPRSRLYGPRSRLYGPRLRLYGHWSSDYSRPIGGIPACLRTRLACGMVSRAPVQGLNSRALRFAGFCTGSGEPRQQPSSPRCQFCKSWVGLLFLRERSSRVCLLAMRVGSKPSSVPRRSRCALNRSKRTRSASVEW